MPVERLCSLVVDHMLIKEMTYNRLKDQIYGLDNCMDKGFSKETKVANKVLCDMILYCVVFRLVYNTSGNFAYAAA